MRESVKTTDKRVIEAFVEACFREGMRRVVCSPGSRNAPIVIALDAHPNIETFVIHDERSAAFYALGMAEISGEPVGVVCTSGSALLNYYPAVSEAYYRSIPLVVISADRSAEWVNHGDGQTIVQENVYGAHIRFSGVIDENDPLEQALESVQEGFKAAKFGWKGPIHFNVPLMEPLYGTAQRTSGNLEYTISEESFPDLRENWDNWKEIWASAAKKMILVGQNNPTGRMKQLLEQLSGDPSVSVLVENTSNLVGHYWVHCIDRTLAGISDKNRESFEPELLITLGGAVISKRIKAFLRNAPVKHHWRVGKDFPEMDTYRHLSHSFEMNPVEFLEGIMPDESAPATENFGGRWKQLDYRIKDRLAEFLNEIPFSDLMVFRDLLGVLPENSFLHLANSSVVRYAQLFDPTASVRYFSNRGTSGIDGSLSTAAGIAMLSKNHLNVMVTGDISFFYDSNALWSRYLEENLRIVLINNSGGGIFRIIEGSRKSEQLQNYFEAHHDTSAEHLCRAFSVAYSQVDQSSNLESELIRLLDSSTKGPALLEVKTPWEQNASVLDSFFQNCAESKS